LAASPPERLRALPALIALVAVLLPGPDVAAQADTPAELDGTVFVGGAPMADGIVVLHHLTGGSQGELDSVQVASDGTFTFRLPQVPDPAAGDVYFASVRHAGVLYFGPAITEAAQLDSAYAVMAYDTIVAPAEGMSVPLRSRSIFFEPDSSGSWRVTDLFQLVNERDRTLVTREGGVVWSHPLPPEATDVATGQGELSFAAADYEDGRLVVRAAIPPGERLFVVRYRVPDVDIAIPNVGPAEAFDILIREPAPPVEVPALELLDRIELEAGSTYLRFTGADVTRPSIDIVAGEERSPPRVEWIALVLAAVLGAAGLWVLRSGSVPAGAAGAAPNPGPASGSGGEGASGQAAWAREALLHQVARLDEDFSSGAKTPEERAVYEERRAALLRRIRTL
jgi:hypothetical protein